MFVKSLLAGAMALVLNPSEQATPTTTYVANQFIQKIVCLANDGEGGFGMVSGTGFKLDDGRWISVNHVTENIGCQINGKPITVTYADPVGDFSIFTVENDIKGGIHANCGGFRDRGWYFGQGYSHGNPVIESIPILFSQIMTDANLDARGWGVLIYNRVQHGQSGGPVLNSAGEVVGTVNALGVYLVLSFSKPLSATPICQGG